MLPENQNKLLGHSSLFNEIASFYLKDNLPNKILLSGKKGIGKTVFAYHLINYILSIDEADKYDIKNNIISRDNRSYKLTINNTHPNFYKIRKKDEKKNIEIAQIRELNSFINKSSFDNKLKIILIEDAELLSINASNSLLKLIEEPNKKVQFILVSDSSKKILDTIKSRCINFRVNLNEKYFSNIIKNYINHDIFDNINNDFKNNYFSPLNYINLIEICEDLDIDIKSIDIETLVKNILINYLNHKKKINIIDFKIYLEIFFLKLVKKKKDVSSYYLSNYFNKKYADIEKYNLDLEPFIIELNSKVLNEK